MWPPTEVAEVHEGSRSSLTIILSTQFPRYASILAVMSLLLRTTIRSTVLSAKHYFHLTQEKNRRTTKNVRKLQKLQKSKSMGNFGADLSQGIAAGGSSRRGGIVLPMPDESL